MGHGNLLEIRQRPNPCRWAIGPLVERDKAVGEFVALGEQADGVDRGLAKCRAIKMAAVVEDHVYCRAGTFCAIDGLDEVPGDRLRGGVAPIGGHGIPENRRHAEAACSAEHDGPACAEGWAEEANRLAGDLLESKAGASELLFDAGAPRESEIRMAPGVVADEMAGGDNAAHECRLRAGMAADEEERSANAAVGEDIEKAGSPGGVGAIIEREGQFARAKRSNEGFAKNPRARGERGVGTPTRSQGKPASSPQARRDFCAQSRIHCPNQCAVMKESTAR